MLLTKSAGAGSSDFRGAQQPRITLVPPASGSAGDEAIALAELAGLHLDPWQQLVLRGALGERPDGHWSAFEVGLVVARQNGKGSILEARELAGLFLLGERMIIHSAHKFDTAMEHLERLVALIEGVPELSSRVRKVNRSHGSEGITLRSGARIRFRARTRSGGARGYTGDCVVFDEAMDLPDELVGAIMPVLSARSSRKPGVQVWYAASAVDQQTMGNGIVLARVREAAMKGENESLAYFEWSAPGHDPGQLLAGDAADPIMWAKANPALGYRITAEHVDREFRAPGMSARQFAVERLGIGDWPDTSENAGRVITREAWAAIEEHDPANRVVSTPVFALDVTPDQTAAAIGVAGRRDDGLAQFAVIAHAPGTDWLIERCADLKRRHPRARFVIDTGTTAAEKLPEFKAARLKVIEANTRDYARACAGFFTAVEERRCRYPAPQPELDDALKGARKAPMGDGWKWSRRNSASPDISPLVAVTLALWAVETRRVARPQVVDLNQLLAAADERNAQR